MIRIAVLAAGLLALGPALQAGQDPRTHTEGDASDGRGTIAVLRRDGLMIPFASYSGNRWSTPWPETMMGPRGTGALEIPVTLNAVPERWWGSTSSPAVWRAWLLDGTDQALKLEAPSIFPVFCRQRLGLRSTHRSSQAVPPLPVDPFPKEGLAVSGGEAIETIEHVDPKSAEWSQLAVALLPDFDRAEDQTLRNIRANDGWRHPVAAAARHQTPVRLESWYRAPMDEPGWMASYVEAVRQYPPGPEDKGCGLETFFGGWVQHNGAEIKRPVQLRAKITYCDRFGALYMLPFGRIRPKNRTYWIYQMSGWEAEWYEIVEVTPGRIQYVVAAYAGGRGACGPI
jgi:hypothetical protein